MNQKEFNKNIILLRLRGCAEQRRSFHYNLSNQHRIEKKIKTKTKLKIHIKIKILIKINNSQRLQSLSLHLITELITLEVSSALSTIRTSQSNSSFSDKRVKNTLINFCPESTRTRIPISVSSPNYCKSTKTMSLSSRKLKYPNLSINTS